MRTPPNQKEKKQKVSLLGVISNGSTGKARQLLKSYNEPDAKSHEDLHFKLSNLYRTTTDKLKLEKELAEIHPHKEFILKYCTPEKQADVEIDPKEVEAKTKVIATGGCSCGNPNCQNSKFLNSGGCSNFSSQSSCACGCSSGIDGNTSISKEPKNAANNDLMILGIIGIITIFALTLKRS